MTVLSYTGGLSLSTTGSTGTVLMGCGQHRLTELSPAPVPEVKETETIKELQGLSLKYRGSCL